MVSNKQFDQPTVIIKTKKTGLYTHGVPRAKELTCKVVGFWVSKAFTSETVDWTSGLVKRLLPRQLIGLLG